MLAIISVVTYVGIGFMLCDKLFSKEEKDMFDEIPQQTYLPANTRPTIEQQIPKRAVNYDGEEALW